MALKLKKSSSNNFKLLMPKEPFLYTGTVFYLLGNYCFFK